MRVICHIPKDDLRRADTATRTAEAAGFDSLATLENAHGPFIPLGVAALATGRIQLEPSVAIAFRAARPSPRTPRGPCTKASNGRFWLGLGSQVKGHNERR